MAVHNIHIYTKIPLHHRLSDLEESSHATNLPSPPGVSSYQEALGTKSIQIKETAN